MLSEVTRSFYVILGDYEQQRKININSGVEVESYSFCFHLFRALASFTTYLSMNSSTVSSVCDHSSSVYLDPTSTGTVRHPATDLR